MTKNLTTLPNTWAFEIAGRILARINSKAPAKGYVLFETGYGPSGLPHIGTYGEVIRTQMVQAAFKEISDIPTKLFVVSDDMDGLRKIPSNVPNPEMLEAHIQKPLTSVPDPFGECASYGDYMNTQLKNFLDRFGVEYEFKSATELYKSGALDEYLMHALGKYDEIMRIMIPTLGEERQKTYSPFLPICPRTGRVLYVPIIERDLHRGTITYIDEETNEKVTVPVTGGHCKLQWKPDLGVRWAGLDVDFEMYGKDHLPNGPLYTQICKVVGGKGPEQFFYELFLDEEGKKISKSKGNGITIEEWLKYAPIESLGFYMYQSPRKAKKLYFDVIPKSVDEYLTFVEKYHASPTKEEKLENPAWYVHGGDVPRHEMAGLNFNLLLNLASACNPTDKSVLWGFISKYSPDVTPEKNVFLDRLVVYAINYYYDFIKPSKVYKTPDQKEIDLLLLVKEKLQALNEKECNANDVQNVFYEVGRDAGYENLRDFFQMVYEVLLGQTQGPRLGSFALIYGINKTVELINNAIAQKL